jgi:NAD(P)-dependent dehydrogenase (short-subunit alcohol dehydrogenase family)
MTTSSDSPEFSGVPPRRADVVPDGLADKRVLVTGGSRGLGEATVRRFAAAGATVVAASRTKPDDPSFPARFVEVDLSTPDGPRALAERALEILGGVDVLIDNAGANTGLCDILDRPDQDWDANLAVNLMSAVRLDRLLVPGMVERGHGVVVHVSSIASHFPHAAQAAYAASKAALNSYSRSLAAAVGPTVRVVSVLPGFIATPGATAQHQKMANSRGVSLEQQQRDIATALNVPMNRPGNPRDAAELIAFLASDRAAWLTGAQYRVDGGILAQV